MPTDLLERDVEKAVCDYAKAKGMLVYKFNSMNRAAVPDRLMISKTGRIWFAEFKRPGMKPTSAQYREHDRLREQGAIVYVIDDIDYGKRIVDMLT
jgi:hypothetical protein